MCLVLDRTVLYGRCTDPICRYYTYEFSPHIINWTYLLLNVERFCAVTFPLHTKQWFSVHSNIYYLSIFAITGIPVFDSIRLRLCVRKQVSTISK